MRGEYIGAHKRYSVCLVRCLSGRLHCWPVLSIINTFSKAGKMQGLDDIPCRSYLISHTVFEVPQAQISLAQEA